MKTRQTLRTQIPRHKECTPYARVHVCIIHHRAGICRLLRARSRTLCSTRPSNKPGIRHRGEDCYALVDLCKALLVSVKAKSSRLSLVIVAQCTVLTL